MSTDEDPTAQRLREAVWADPKSDAPRMVYADYLMDRGDLLGEVIAVELERARIGGPPLPRQYELAQLDDNLGRRAAQPLGQYLDTYRTERGFLSMAIPLTNLPPEIATHPAWSTVSRLVVLNETHVPVLANPHVSLDTLCARETILRDLSHGNRPLPCAALASPRDHRGLHVSSELYPVFDHRGAFDRVRAISLASYALLDAWMETEPIVRDGRLMRHLEHLDLTFTSVRLDDLRIWRRWFRSTTLARMSFQIPLGVLPPDPDDEPSDFPRPPDRFVSMAVDRDTRMFLQLEDPLTPEQLELLVEAVAVVGERRSKIAVHDHGDPRRITERQPGLADRLRRHFSEVFVVPGPIRSLAP